MNNPMSGISGAYQLISSVEIKTEVVNLRTTYTEEIFLYVSEQNSLSTCVSQMFMLCLFSCLSRYLYSTGHAVFIKAE